MQESNRDVRRRAAVDPVQERLVERDVEGRQRATRRQLNVPGAQAVGGADGHQAAVDERAAAVVVGIGNRQDLVVAAGILSKPQRDIANAIGLDQAGIGQRRVAGDVGHVDRQRGNTGRG